MPLDDTALSRLRSWAEQERKKSIEQIVIGALTDRMYGYSCGYIKALDDTTKVLDQILGDLQGG